MTEMPPREASDGTETRVLQLVGLARRAGRAVAGTQSVREAGRRGEVRLLVVARDATENAHRRVRGLVDDPAVGVIACGTRQALGRAVGREAAAVVGILDTGLAGRIGIVAGSGRSPTPAPGGTGDEV